MCRIHSVVVFFYSLVAIGHQFSDPNYIPEYLLECYSSPVQLLPMTMRTLIDIVRKVESDPNLYMDLRLQTNAILKRFWRDGIHKDPNVAYAPNVIPYSGAGMQFYKYAVLRNIIPISGGPPFPDDALTLNERCTLHQMLSNSMEKWERGDEYLVCPMADPQRQVKSEQMTGSVKSSCPVEKGVVQTDYGNVSPNHILQAIATWLQPEEVHQMRLLDGLPRKRSLPLYFPYNKTINNFWAATIAGDIAELMVFQLPLSSTPKFGPGGFWNDDILPARLYQKIDFQGVLHDFWQDTDAELLGGIDGAMIGNQISAWYAYSGSLRLSQVLEMFYSTRGGQFPNQRRACNRQDFYVGTLAKSRGLIQQQVTNFAELLSVNSVSFILDETFISTNIVKTFNAYKDYLGNLVKKFPPCPDKSAYSEAKIRLIVLFDATWDSYTTLQILSKLSVSVDVSKFGSTITVINGMSGETVVSEASSVGDLYLQWISANDSVKEVKSTDMTNGFLRIKRIVESDSFRRKKSEPAADVTLVLAKTTLLTDTSFDRIKSTLNAIKSQTPEMRFIYVIRTPDSRPWVKLTSLQYSQNDRIITADDDNLQNLYPNLEFIQDMPSSIIPPLCSEAKSYEKVLFVVEQYVTPGVPRNYVILPAYFCSSSYVNVEIENLNYGDVMLCFSRSPLEVEKNPQCTSIAKFEKFNFWLEDPCSSKVTTGSLEDWDSDCRPVYMRVIALKSTNSCTERDCRFMDQIRFNFNIGGITCRREYGVPCSATVTISCIHLYIGLVVLLIYYLS